MIDHNFLDGDERIAGNFNRSLIVVLITAIMMVVEIVTGYVTGSMALLADGWHMASHVGAIGISLLAYKFAKSPKMNQLFSFGTGKFIPLGGYTSAIILAGMSLVMIIESFHRFYNPVAIAYNEAIIVAVIGLVVNVVCAYVLSDHHNHHHDHDHEEHVHDHNLESAYMHVVADSFTSLLAIFALLFARSYGYVWIDPLMGVLGGVVIMRWSWSLLRETGYELLDGHSKIIKKLEINEFLEAKGIIVLDLHVWRIAPDANACELVVKSNERRGPDYYRELLSTRFSLEHLTIEERT